MGEDILADWKENRFILASNELTNTNKHVIILTEVGYWAEHFDELLDWCNPLNATVQGMTVTINDDKTLTMFILRWSK